MDIPEFLIKSDPGEQLFTGIALLLAGLVIWPAMAAILLPIATWMNGFWSDTALFQGALRVFKVFFAVAITSFAILGCLYLLVYSCAKADLITDPWA